MLRKVATFWLLALAVATFADANPASAKPSGSAHVSVGNRWQASSIDLCSGAYSFSYTQRITVDGESTMAPVESLAPPGRYEAVLVNSCDGYDMYAFGSCGCLIVAVKLST